MTYNVFSRTLNPTQSINLLYSQTTKHHGERFYCLRCFNGFNSTNSRNKHFEYCRHSKEGIRRVLPQPTIKDGEGKKPELFFGINKL